MGIMDAFAKEDRVEITVSQLYELVKEAGRADLFRNGVKNKVPYSHILCVLDGAPGVLDMGETVIWHDAKTDPPKSPGQYYGKKDDTNSMWPCNYQDGRWTLSDYPEQEMQVTQWAEYTDFRGEDG